LSRACSTCSPSSRFTLALYGSVHDQNYILGPGPDTAVLFGGILEVIVALAGIGTAVALYPVLKRQNQGAAQGLVGSRVLEAAGILAGVACLLAIVTLRQTGAGNGALITGQTLAIWYDRIFLLSQSLMPVVNDLLLGFLLYKSRLVPRVLPVLAFIGAPLLLVEPDRKVQAFALKPVDAHGHGDRVLRDLVHDQGKRFKTTCLPLKSAPIEVGPPHRARRCPSKPVCPACSPSAKSDIAV
jgi:Domain of unknown function (DUF4386)